ncbi:MAG: MoaD/ThiS family protein [Candidatus Hodarchaeota archaeon]
MSSNVRIQLLNIFRLELKEKYLHYQGETVGEVIAQFEREHLEKLPDYLKSKNQEHLNEQILILLNGSNIKNLNELKTKIKEGDEIQLSVPIIGG